MLSLMSVMYLSSTCLYVWETGKYLNVDLKNKTSESPVYESCLLVLPSECSVNHIKTCHYLENMQLCNLQKSALSHE